MEVKNSPSSDKNAPTWGNFEQPDSPKLNNKLKLDLERVLKNPEKSRSHKDREKTGREFCEFLEQHDEKIGEISIQNFIRFWFVAKSAKRKLKASNLKRKLALLLEFLSSQNIEITHTGVKRINFVIQRWERAILEISPDEKMVTKYLPLNRLKTLCLALWKENPTKRSEIINKCSSVTFLGCWLSGARLVDMMRLHWEDLKIRKNPSGLYLVARIRHSKGNAGKRPEQLTFLSLKDPSLNIIKRLKRWWKFSGKPCSGKIFKNKINGKELTRAASVRSARNMAKYINWPKDHWPRAHSGRKSLVLLLLKLGIDPVSLRIYLRWGPNSVMNSYYQSVGLETTEYGTSHKFGQILNSGKIFDLEKDL